MVISGQCDLEISLASLSAACFSWQASVETNSHLNSHQTILASPYWRGQLHLTSLICWCREGVEPP
jgi:hypothetical protein